MELLQARQVVCPCCGESVELMIDCSAGSREYVEDCQVCCRPVLLTVIVAGDGTATVRARPENA